jgi:hypothetical protein
LENEMGYPLYEKVDVAYEYDFAVDGGAVSSIALRSLGANGLLSGLSIVKAHVIVETAIVSGSGTATIGDGSDDDGYFKDLVATAAGAYSSMSALGGALLRSSATSIEGEVEQKLSADVTPELVISTGAVTAGKFKIVFECVRA